MSKLNKLVTNYPVSLSEDEIKNLSATLAPVVSACGGGGGGTPIYYYGDDVNINISPSRVIRLTDAATAKLNRDIPTKVSDLTDSANYQTVAGMDEYLREAEAQATYLTKSSADTLYAPLSTTADVDALKAVSGDFSLYYKKTETSSKKALSDEFAKYVTITDFNGVTGDVSILKSASSEWNKISDKLDTTAFSTVSGTFLTEVPDTYATKEYTNDASANAFNQATALIPDVSNFITKDVNDLTNYYNKTQTSSDSELSTEFAKYATTTYVDSKDPVLIGDSNITATSSTIDGHTQWNLAINATPVVTNTKLVGDNCVTAHTTQTSGEWIVGLEQTAYEAIDSVGGISTDVATLKNASADWNEVSAKLDSSVASTTYQTKTDMANYLTTSDAATTYQPKGNYAPETVTATVNTLTAASASWNEVSAKLGTAQYATDSAKFVTKPDTTQTVLNNNYLIYSTLTGAGTTTGWMPLSANYYSKTEADGRYQKILDMGNYLTTAKYATDSATFVTSSSNTITGTKQYALTTTGWAEVSTPTIPDITANNGISANGHTIGIDNTNLVTNTQYAWTTTGWSDIELSAYLPLSGGTVSGDVIVKSTGKNLLAVNTTATLMGQSRVNSLTDTSAIGTNWLGVNSLGGGFLKNVQGGDVGALNGTSIQINFAPNGNTAYGNITVNSQGNESKVVHVPTASYDSMSNFDNTNGPNYMLRKTASGFDIGACVINVTQLPAQTEANTYYFIYDT